MRFFEFVDTDLGLDKFVMILKNFIGRAASKKQAAKLNWSALQKIATDSGFEMGADYETFKSMYDSSPVIQALVKTSMPTASNSMCPALTKTPKLR